MEVGESSTAPTSSSLDGEMQETVAEMDAKIAAEIKKAEEAELAMLQLETKLKETEQQLAASTVTLEERDGLLIDLRMEVDWLTSSVNQKEAEIGDLQKRIVELDDVEKRMKTMEKELDEARTEAVAFKEIQKILGEALEQETQNRKELAAAMADGEAKVSLFAEMQSRVEELESIKENLQKELALRDEVGGRREAETQAVVDELASARAAAKKMEERLAETALLLAQKEANEDVTREQRKDLQHHLEYAESRGLDLEGRVKELEDSVASKLEELERRQEERVAYEGRIQQLTEALQVEERKVQDLQLTVRQQEALGETVRRLSLDLDAQVAACSALETDKSSLETRVADLEVSLRKALADCALESAEAVRKAELDLGMEQKKACDLVHKLAESEALVEKLQAEVAGKEMAEERGRVSEDRAMQLESALTEMSSRLRCVREEANLKDQEVSDMSGQLNHAQKEITAMRYALEEANEGGRTLEEKVVELQSALAEMGSRLRYAQEAANRSEQELADLTSKERAADMRTWRLEEALRETREEVVMLSEEIHKKDGELAQAKEAASSAEMKSEEMERSYEGRLADIQSVVGGVKVKLMEKMEDSERKEKELVATMLEREAKLSAALKQAEEKAEKAEKDASDLRKNVEFAHLESKRLRSRIVELEGAKKRLEEAERALAPFRCSVEDTAERLRGAERSLQAAVMRVEEAESRTQALDEVMRESRKAAQGAEERCKSFAAKLRTAEEKVVEFFAMEMRAKEAEKKVSEWMENQDRMEEREAALEGALLKAEAALRRSEGEGEELKKRAEDLAASLSEAEARVFELESHELSLREMVERESVRAEEAEKEAEARLAELEKLMDAKLSSAKEGASHASQQVQESEVASGTSGVHARKINKDCDRVPGAEESGLHKKDSGWIIVETDGGNSDGKDEVLGCQGWRAKSDQHRKQIEVLEEQVRSLLEANKQAEFEALQREESEASLRAQVTELQERLENSRVAEKSDVPVEPEKKTFRDVTIEGEITSLKAKVAESDLIRARATELEQKLKDAEIREHRQQMAIMMWEGRVSAAEQKLREYKQQVARNSKSEGDLAEALLQAAEKVQKAEAEAVAAREAEKQAKGVAAALQDSVKSLEGKVKSVSTERERSRGKKENNKEVRRADAEIHRGVSEAAAKMESASTAGLLGKSLAAAESQASTSSTRKKKSKSLAKLVEDSATSSLHKAVAVPSRGLVADTRNQSTSILKSMLTHMLIAALALGVGYVLSPVVKQ
ncbi:hypothetical protein CBR_g28475 [Chara braunii]|uniref:Uncharacterized protein n=1 Tax=Chara braunii TaxID=69332 RepID=A0A388JW46_CHABU|nr:hypothetical protein CBR_g28475 [Chara braunii]|eukprot:GBG61998.1 hypothetical protein CBR_g28475 [Chara braunii]